MYFYTGYKLKATLILYGNIKLIVMNINISFFVHIKNIKIFDIIGIMHI